LLTDAGSAAAVGPAPLFVYVREYVPPVTSGLVQQLSLEAPQFVIPAPPGAQLKGITQDPDEQLPDPLHPIPVATLLQDVVLTTGWQIWQLLLGFEVPDDSTVPPMKQPLWHVPALQTSPLPQPAPVMTLVHELELTSGWQLRQGLLGFRVAGNSRVPPMKQPLWHVPALQISPLPQPPPVMTSVHEVELAPGWQLRQGLLGAVWPEAYSIPPMKHPTTQLPALQTSPSVVVQLVPSPRLDHPEILVDGWQLWQVFAALSVPVISNAFAM
jgi:hypothetical protein